MSSHIDANGKFQSDKYPTCPPDKVPLSVNDKTAQDLLWAYAQRRRAVDSEFSNDLEQRLVECGYEPATATSNGRQLAGIASAIADDVTSYKSPRGTMDTWDDPRVYRMLAREKELATLLPVVLGRVTELEAVFEAARAHMAAARAYERWTPDSQSRASNEAFDKLRDAAIATRALLRALVGVT